MDEVTQRPISRKPVALPQASPTPTDPEHSDNARAHLLSGAELSSPGFQKLPSPVVTEINDPEERIVHIDDDPSDVTNQLLLLHTQNSPPPSQQGFSDENTHGDEGLPHRPRRRWQLKLWAVEVLCCLVSIALLAGLTSLLRYCHNKPLPDWPMGFTVNTGTALISTLARSAMMIPLSEGISQLKWNWLVQGRPVMDVDAFDKASRGVWGSIKMICTGRGQLYTIVAAVVLLSSLATSTITQSAITFVDKQLNATEFLSSHHATALAATGIPPLMGKDNWFSRVNEEVGDVNEPDDDILREFGLLVVEQNNAMFHAFTEGLVVGLGKKTVQPLNGNVCTTASCAWSRLSSIGLCAEARNVTHNLVVEEDEDGGFSASLPPFPEAILRMPSPGPSGSGPISLFNVSTPSVLNLDGYPMHQGSQRALIPDNGTSPWPPVWASSGFQYGQDTDILNTTMSQIIFLYNNREHANYTASIRAIEMMAHFCVQTYNVSVVGGVSKTELLSNHTKISDVNYAFEDDGYMFLEEEDGGTTQVMKWPIPDASFGASLDRIDVLSFAMLTAIFRDAFDPFAGGAPSVVPFTETEIDVTTFANIGRIGENIAMTMSNTLRGYGDLVGGTPYTTVTHIVIQWEWLALLATQIVLTIIFLAIVIVHTSILGVDVVKSSEIASLLSISQVNDPTAARRGSEPVLSDGLQTAVDRSVIGTLRPRDGRWVVEISEDHTPRKAWFRVPWNKELAKRT